MSAEDKLRSFAEAREPLHKPLPGGALSYEDCHELLDQLHYLRSKLQRHRGAWQGISDVFDWISENYPNALVTVPTPLFRAFEAARRTLLED